MSAVRDAQNVSAREKGVILKTWWFLLAALWGNDEIWACVLGRALRYLVTDR